MTSQLQWNLPNTLLELTFMQSRQYSSGSFASHVSRRNLVFRRNAHALALKPKPDVRAGFLSSSLEISPRERRSRSPAVYKAPKKPLYSRMDGENALSILSERVESLMQVSQEQDAPAYNLHYNEEELQMFYADILANPEEELQQKAENVPVKTAREVLEETMDLVTVEETVEEMDEEERRARTSLAATLAARTQQKETRREDVTVPTLDSTKTHHGIIMRVRDVVQAMEESRKITSTSVATPVSVLSGDEWTALIELCIDEKEYTVAEYVLSLYERSGQVVPEKLFNSVADAYAKVGDVKAIEAFYGRFINTPSERQRDLHIKTYINSPNHDIYAALGVLHKYEEMALLPQVQSYTRLICALFSARSAQASAQAWDLFAHMRYVAHPKPDELLYALMIRACAGTGYSHSSYVAEPERAMDLWTELREDMRHPPSVGTYDAIILACARTRSHASEAFRLAREMLDSHRDAFGNAYRRPRRDTFAALLSAAKMSGDLLRARWILAELLNLCEKEGSADGSSDLAPDGRIMVHVFHAYASYKPPFRRGSTRIVESKEAEPATENNEDTAIEAIPQPTGRFGKAPPQTSSEVIAEAQTLFQRVVDDTNRKQASQVAEGAPSVGAFSKVKLTPVLVNSYLSIHYNHGSIEQAQQLFNSIFEEVGVERTPRSYVEALERCAYEKPGAGRHTAYEFADELWKSWSELESQLQPEGASARLIERARIAMIRICSLVGELDRAMDLLRDFTTRYPYTAVSTPAPKHPMRSMRTQLFGARPLVRLSTPTEIPDDAVPPVLTFFDIEILFQRLVTEGASRKLDISYVTFLSKAYEGALRTRRERTLKS